MKNLRGSRKVSRRPRLFFDSLETRTVLSNVGVSYLAGVLTITGDTHNDAFKITEAPISAGGTVMVAPLNGSTTINAFSIPYTTPGPVSTINVNLPGTRNNIDKVQLFGAGKNTLTTVKDVNINVTGGLDLGLQVNNVDNSGAFKLTTDGFLLGIGSTAPLALPTGFATIDNSRFSEINIVDTSPDCQAKVELGNDTAGPVNVNLGDAGGNMILLQNNDSFGSTTLHTGNGGGDSIVVNNARLRDLTATEGNGNGDVISVNTVTVNPLGFGVFTGQGNGNNDTTTINAVTAPLGTPAQNLSPNQDSASIVVNQGNGSNDTATVSNSSVPDDIIVNQGNGNNDTATVSNSSASNAFDTTGGVISITQGNGNNDTATVTLSKVLYGDINIFQGDGDFDRANITGSSAGTVTPIAGLGLVDLFGTARITQGDGFNDIATLNSVGATFNQFNNVVILQGDNDNTRNQRPLFQGDEVHVNDTNIVSDLTIRQGDDGDDALADDLGNNLVTIGDTSPVTVGGTTSIDQGGANNVIQLGGAGTAQDFYTAFLDIFMGNGGGAYITAMNTVVDQGSFLFNPFVIDAGGTGNVFQDLGNNSGLVASGNFTSF